MSDSPDAAARLTAIESLLTHLQHELGQMHSVLLAHTAELQAMDRRIEKFEGKLERLEEEPEDSDPRAHKPPHY
ncbi:SlyX family protein [Alienimonas sp. DA493]|uniref:SlyX family protein n=1 Tax=Alienimonas sp. DA493 TaxID=3373605 RepID=UPI00375516A1